MPRNGFGGELDCDGKERRERLVENVAVIWRIKSFFRRVYRTKPELVNTSRIFVLVKDSYKTGVLCCTAWRISVMSCTMKDV